MNSFPDGYLCPGPGSRNSGVSLFQAMPLELAGYYAGFQRAMGGRAITLQETSSQVTGRSDDRKC